MDASDVIALSAAGLSVIGTIVAIHNANSAKRSADAAWEAARTGNFDRLRAAFVEYLIAVKAFIQTCSDAVNMSGTDNGVLRRVFLESVHHHPAAALLFGGLPPDSEFYKRTVHLVDHARTCMGLTLRAHANRGPLPNPQYSESTEEASEKAREELAVLNGFVYHFEEAGHRYFGEEYARLSGRQE